MLGQPPRRPLHTSVHRDWSQRDPAMPCRYRANALPTARIHLRQNQPPLIDVLLPEIHSVGLGECRHPRGASPHRCHQLKPPDLSAASNPRAWHAVAARRVDVAFYIHHWASCAGAVVENATRFSTLRETHPGRPQCQHLKCMFGLIGSNPVLSFLLAMYLLTVASTACAKATCGSGFSREIRG